MLLKRVLTAAVGIPAVLVIIMGAGSRVFFVFVLLAAVAALTEFYTMVLPAGEIRARLLGTVLGACVLFAAYLDAHSGNGAPAGHGFITSACCVFSLLVLFFYHFFSDRDLRGACSLIGLQVFGIFYIALLFSYVILIRKWHDGSSVLLFFLLVTWAGDSGGYLIGSWKGRHALCRTVSPNKTIEGALGSMVLGVAAACACRVLFLGGLDLLNCLVLGAGINIMNQLGDLCESVVKRSAGAKDSGSVFPGHGGVLDRIDSLLFAAPFVFYYIAVMVPELWK